MGRCRVAETGRGRERETEREKEGGRIRSSRLSQLYSAFEDNLDYVRRPHPTGKKKKEQKGQAGIGDREDQNKQPDGMRGPRNAKEDAERGGEGGGQRETRTVTGPDIHRRRGRA